MGLVDKSGQLKYPSIETCVLLPQEFSLKVNTIPIEKESAPSPHRREQSSEEGFDHFKSLRSNEEDGGVSNIKVCASQPIAAKSKFLPFSGTIRTDVLPMLPLLDSADIRDSLGNYDEIISRSGRRVRFCNWVRFVRCKPRFDLEINLIATRSGGSIVFEVIREIIEGEDLVVFLLPDSNPEDSYYMSAFAILRSSIYRKTFDSIMTDAPLDLSKSLLSGVMSGCTSLSSNYQSNLEQTLRNLKSEKKNDFDERDEGSCSYLNANQNDTKDNLNDEDDEKVTDDQCDNDKIANAEQELPIFIKDENVNHERLKVENTERTERENENDTLKITNSDEESDSEILEIEKNEDDDLPPQAYSGKRKYEELDEHPDTEEETVVEKMPETLQHNPGMLWSNFLSSRGVLSRYFPFGFQPPFFPQPPLSLPPIHPQNNFAFNMEERNNYLNFPRRQRPPTTIEDSGGENNISTRDSITPSSTNSMLSRSSDVDTHPGISLRPPKRRERTLLPCSECGKCFDRPSLLKRHMRTHTGEKPHVCDVCGKGFSTSSSLNTHRRIHSGEKPHQCGVCGKRFTASSNLYYHKMTHVKEKPHKCTLCTRSFPTPGDLRSHMFVHNGQWPFKCKICGKGFSKMTNLKNHKMLHTGERSSKRSSTPPSRTQEESSSYLYNPLRNHASPFSLLSPYRNQNLPSPVFPFLNLHAGIPLPSTSVPPSPPISPPATISLPKSTSQSRLSPPSPSHFTSTSSSTQVEDPFKATEQFAARNSIVNEDKDGEEEREEKEEERATISNNGRSQDCPSTPPMSNLSQSLSFLQSTIAHNRCIDSQTWEPGEGGGPLSTVKSSEEGEGRWTDVIKDKDYLSKQSTRHAPIFNVLASKIIASLTHGAGEEGNSAGRVEGADKNTFIIGDSPTVSASSIVTQSISTAFAKT